MELTADHHSHHHIQLDVQHHTHTRVGRIDLVQLEPEGKVHRRRLAADYLNPLRLNAIDDAHRGRETLNLERAGIFGCLPTLNAILQDRREVIEAAIEGLNRSDFSAELILCCMRGTDNHEANLETVKLAKDYIGKGVCCIDIAGAEALFPTENFGDLFALAREEGTPFTIHAGEADGPKSVWKALEYGTKRLGHGVRSLEDPKLIEKIVAEGITLEVCPTSNIHTCMFPSIEEYPLRKLMDAGVKVTINTDNMTVSNINLAKEYGKLIAAFDLTDEEIKGFAKNAVNACFASEEKKKELLEKIEAAV